MKRPMKVWPPGRGGYPTCPGCGEWITVDPGPGGVMPDPSEGWRVGRYAHAACAREQEENQ